MPVAAHVTGMVQDDAVRDLRDEAISSGSSNSVGDSGNMEQFGEEGDGFLREAVQIKSGSSRVGNFAKRIVKLFFNLRKRRVEIVQGQGGKCH